MEIGWKNLLVENLLESSLVSQRLVYDAVKYHGDSSNIEINKVYLICLVRPFLW